MIKVTSPVYWHHDFLTWWTEKGISLSKSQEDPPRAFLMPFSKTELKSNTEETQILAADKAQNVSTDTRASLPVSVQRCQLILSSWRRKWQPTPVFLPGESHGQRGLVGYSLWGCKESDMTKQLTSKHTQGNQREMKFSLWRQHINNLTILCWLVGRGDGADVGPRVQSFNYARWKCFGDWTHGSVQSISHVRLFETPWTAAHQASLSITNSWSLLKLMFIESMMPSNHPILCCPLPLPPSIFPSIRLFSKWVSSSHQVAKVLEFQLQHQSFQWTPRTDFL